MAHNSDRQDGLKSLREWLEQVGAGSIEDIATLTSKLVNAWPALAGGGDEGMTAAKLGGRVEAPTWAPPVLTSSSSGMAGLSSARPAPSVTHGKSTLKKAKQFVEREATDSFCRATKRSERVRRRHNSPRRFARGRPTNA